MSYLGHDYDSSSRHDGANNNRGMQDPASFSDHKDYYESEEEVEGGYPDYEVSVPTGGGGPTSPVSQSAWSSTKSLSASQHESKDNSDSEEQSSDSESSDSDEDDSEEDEQQVQAQKENIVNSKRASTKRKKHQKSAPTVTPKQKAPRRDDVGRGDIDNGNQLSPKLNATEAFATHKKRTVSGKPRALVAVLANVPSVSTDLPTCISKAKKKGHAECRKTIQQADERANSMFKDVHEKFHLKLAEWERYANNLMGALDTTHAVVTEQSREGKKLVTEKKKLQATVEKQTTTINNHKAAIDSKETALTQKKKDLRAIIQKLTASDRQVEKLTADVEKLKQKLEDKPSGGNCGANVHANTTNGLGHPEEHGTAHDNLDNNGPGRGPTKSQKNGQIDLQQYLQKKQIDLWHKRQSLQIEKESKESACAQKKESKLQKRASVMSTMRLMTGEGAVSNGMFDSQGMRSLSQNGAPSYHELNQNQMIGVSHPPTQLNYCQQNYPNNANAMSLQPPSMQMAGGYPQTHFSRQQQPPMQMQMLGGNSHNQYCGNAGAFANAGHLPQQNQYYGNTGNSGFASVSSIPQHNQHFGSTGSAGFAMRHHSQHNQNFGNTGNFGHNVPHPPHSQQNLHYGNDSSSEYDALHHPEQEQYYGNDSNSEHYPPPQYEMPTGPENDPTDTRDEFRLESHGSVRGPPKKRTHH